MADGWSSQIVADGHFLGAGMGLVLVWTDSDDSWMGPMDSSSQMLAAPGKIPVGGGFPKTTR